MTRIKMPDGHIQLNLEGVTYNPDEEGCFHVPVHHVAELIRVHGAEPAPGVQDLQQRADTADAAVVSLVQQLAFARAQAKTLRAQADAAKERHAAALEAAAKDAEARADKARAEAAEDKDRQDAEDAARRTTQEAAGSVAPTAAGRRASIPRVATG